MSKRSARIVRRWRMAYASVYPERPQPKVLERGGGWWHIDDRSVRINEISAESRRLELKAKRLNVSPPDVPAIERSVENYLRAHHGITQHAIKRSLELLIANNPNQALDVLKNSRVEVDAAINSYCPELAGQIDVVEGIASHRK